MYKIGRHKAGTIRNLNIFTHASDGYIAMSGRVTEDNVSFSPDDRAELNDSLLGDKEEIARTVFGPRGMTEKQKFLEDITIANVREAFAKDGEIVIYACHGGLDKKYLGRIAKLFGVKVKGFTKMIRYTPKTTKDGKRIIGMTYGIEGSPLEVINFHQLIPDVEVP